MQERPGTAARVVECSQLKEGSVFGGEKPPKGVQNTLASTFLSVSSLSLYLSLCLLSLSISLLTLEVVKIGEKPPIITSLHFLAKKK